MNPKQPLTWIVIGLGLVGAVLGVSEGLSNGHWGSAAVALGLIVIVIPRFWNGLAPSHHLRGATTSQWLLWHLAAAGAMAVIVLAITTSTSAPSLLAASLMGVALVGVVVTVDIAERKRRHDLRTRT